jgi:hypothetical protein
MAEATMQRYALHPHTPLPTQDDADALIRTLDRHFHIFDSPMKAIYREIRDKLIHYVLIESSTESEEEEVESASNLVTILPSVAPSTSSSSPSPSQTLSTDLHTSIPYGRLRMSDRDRSE